METEEERNNQSSPREGEKLPSLETVSNEEVKQAPKVNVASKYETQSESELVALCGQSVDNKADSGDRTKAKGGEEEASETPKKTGRIKRKERRLRNEPQNITGKYTKQSSACRPLSGSETTGLH